MRHISELILDFALPRIVSPSLAPFLRLNEVDHRRNVSPVSTAPSLVASLRISAPVHLSRRNESSTQCDFRFCRRHFWISVFGGGGAAVFLVALEEVVRLRTTDLVGGGVMLRALLTLLFAFVYAYARSGPVVTVES